ncbi:alpha/beta fold hydrolase [Flagellimonas meridianipacifica]|uniref:Pimeloyl-ACP methyl ester carboxylesterase n=1 Tax=Flagellimonas meridianipacifica TaxID=1080225 RepID=A0A2T0MJD5_9FLAO|nr:alpha/beta hydrolase [Allomuricauda pacifica]PRX57692.1 pimeloyl-ACP methyl ester carboxylesterase [Allomuricauda pacifica]
MKKNIVSNFRSCFGANVSIIFILAFIFLGCESVQGNTSGLSEFKEVGKKESINETFFIESNGAQLYVEVKGEDRTKPIMLFLHGGPGDVVFGLFPFQTYVGKELEKNFVMAYFHQRGMVKSKPVNISTQTLENHIDDVDNVINFLVDKMDRNKVILMGHSWGGLLGTLYLLRDESKIERFIAVASPFNFSENSRESYSYTMEWAKEQQNEQAIKELEAYAKPPVDTFDKVLVKSKWASQAFGGIAKNISIPKILSDSGIKELKQEWQLMAMEVAKVMFDSLNEVKIDEEINQIKTPIFFIAGRNDATVPPKTVEKTFDLYKGEKKYMVFENSHHLVFVDEPNLFIAQIEQFGSK